MSQMNSDQLYRSTLGIYSSLMEEFNPSLQKLVSLGNSYIQAFQALAVTSEAYFSALSKVGEKAFHTMSSQSIGEVLIQVSESQKRLTLELQGVFRWFSMEVIQQMDNIIKTDKDYISGSRKQYEMEVHSLATALERQFRRGYNQDGSEYVQFLRKSHDEALKEEERRHRFLAEKHCALIQSIAHLMNKTGGSLQQKADAWMNDVNATRGRESRQPPPPDNYMRMKEEDTRKNREEMTLGNIPSRAPSPQGSISQWESVGGGGGGRSMRARVAHHPGGSNSTLLPFSKGEMITVLVQQARKGWLYGRSESTSHQGWFPGSYVEAVDDPPQISSSRSTLRSSSSMSSLLDQPQSRNPSGGPPPPPPPPTPSLSSNRQHEPVSPTSDRGAESYSVNKGSKSHGSPPELFPRGTNPFATIKLKPTLTDDRSAPRLNRR
uniref:brain-specific angiogenesis inhibitor 1-associated protein 2-like protein 2 n=1 Tax=Scatophagus argus TaxID=75038 RepID=UPI001ED824A4|nr:brain-specific angiogenesis inhibitor 1-associated protein 2-like protein 2 [Scatophagus argus]